MVSGIAAYSLSKLLVCQCAVNAQAGDWSIDIVSKLHCISIFHFASV